MCKALYCTSVGACIGNCPQRDGWGTQHRGCCGPVEGLYKQSISRSLWVGFLINSVKRLVRSIALWWFWALVALFSVSLKPFWVFTSTPLMFIFLPTDCLWWFGLFSKMPLTIFLPTMCSMKSRLFLTYSLKFSEPLPDSKTTTYLDICYSLSPTLSTKIYISFLFLC